jgi:outer membrane protein TolC
MIYLKRRRYGMGWLCLCAILAGCAAYQPAPLSLASPLKPSLAALGVTPPLTMGQVAALAVRDDPDLLAARAAHHVGQAELLSAGLLPDPAVTVGFAALISGPADVPALSGSLAQDLSALVTYRANVVAAKAGLAQMDAGILWQEWQVAGQAEALCVALGADAQILASLKADDAALAQVNHATQAQMIQGNLTLSAGAASMAAAAATRTAFNDAVRTRDEDLDQLDALLGLAPGVAVPVMLPAVIAPIPPALAERAIATIAQRRPDLIALRYGYDAADARLRAAILSQFLPISVGGNGGRDTTNVWSAGPQLILTLPLFNRNRGGIAAATATRAELAAQFSASLAAAASGAKALLVRTGVLRAESQAADDAAASAAQIAGQAQSAYDSGALDAVSAVDLQTAAADRQREAILLRQQLLTATLALDTMLGIGLPPILLPVPEPAT